MRTFLLFLSFFISLVLMVSFSLCNEVMENEEKNGDFYNFLYNSMKRDIEIRKVEHKRRLHRGKLESEPVKLPAEYNPLPGRSSNGDYWPLFPMSNQYFASVTLDPARGRHSGGDMVIPVPYWGFLDLSGHFIERAQDYWTKVGYVNDPINMFGFKKDQLATILSNPSLHWNRVNQPLLPVALLPRKNVPMACKPPLCNPYHANLGVGVERNVFIEDGAEGELDLPIPIGKDIAYRLPISGNIHFDLDDISVGYGQNLSPIDPFALMPDDRKTVTTN